MRIPHEGGTAPPHTGPASDVLPEARRSQTGVSSEYVPEENHQWFVLRVTYNRNAKAADIIRKADVQSYVPMHYVTEIEIGKKKRTLRPLLPNLIFVYATRETVDAIVKKRGSSPSVLKYYLDKTKPQEDNGKHPPLTVPAAAMESFIIATSTDSSHVRIVSPEQCHYKSGDMVKVIAGDFKGTTGRVARIAGQQRVVVEVSGLCLVATAYVPTDFIKIIKDFSNNKRTKT